ncbi:hypothetical protein ID866_2098 [Astraeus odoratus]|nr:hypothetical protein ID866_2098 [Astraeus odoratus]
MHFDETAFRWTMVQDVDTLLDSYDNPLKPHKRRYRCKGCGVCVVSHNSITRRYSVWGGTLERDGDSGRILDWEKIKPTAHQFYGTRGFDSVALSVASWRPEPARPGFVLCRVFHYNHISTQKTPVMLSKRVLAIARKRPLLASGQSQNVTASISKAWNVAGTQLIRAQFHSSRLLQAEIVKVPQMAESISEGTLKSWSKQVGDTVEVDEEIDVTVNAPMSGTIVELLANEEDTVVVGQDLFKIEAGAATSAKPSEHPKDLPESSKRSDPEEPKDQQVDKSTPPPPPPSATERRSGGISSEGPRESKKELKEDSKASAKKETKEEQPTTPARAPGSRNETRVKMSRMRLRIAERLKESQNAAASLTTFNEIDMSALMEMRKKYKDEVLKEHDVKLGFMSAFARACTLALQELPTVNASIDGDEIVYRDYVDLSVAVATPKGLVTPVVRNVESMGFLQIEKEIVALGKKARDGKLTLEDMAGGTFTISNGGVFGSLFGTPIINLPQSAVLGMHTIKDRAVVVNGQIVVRPIMIVALTYDHRLLDGRDAVTFLVKVKEYVEDPRKMLLAPF